MDKIRLIEKAIYEAESGKKVSSMARVIPGMTSDKIRKFLSIVCSGIEVYLEIGLYKGATFFSAIENNPHLVAIGCDNWSQFEGSKTEFRRRLRRFEKRNNIAWPYIFNLDCFSPAFLYKMLDKPKVDAFFYDGDHSYESQFKAVKLLEDMMNEECIFIVDDWKKWGKIPTIEALKNSKVEIIKNWECFDGWWEGIGIFLIKKNKGLHS
jgi:hypothetical protein